MNDGGQAFPGPCDALRDGSPIYPAESGGMSLRDYFAAKSLVGGLVGTECLMADTKDKLAEWCYEMADAMLEARKK